MQRGNRLLSRWVLRGSNRLPIQQSSALSKRKEGWGGGGGGGKDKRRGHNCFSEKYSVNGDV